MGVLVIASATALKGQAPTSDFVEAWKSSEGRLAWLTYAIGSFLEGLATPGSRPLLPASKLELHATLYARMAHKVFDTMEWMESSRASGMHLGTHLIGH